MVGTIARKNAHARPDQQHTAGPASRSGRLRSWDCKSPSRSAPFEVNDLPVILVRSVNATKLHAQAVASRCGLHPARRVARLEDVGHLRQVYEMNPARVFPNLPFMRVAKNVRLHLFPKTNNRI